MTERQLKAWVFTLNATTYALVFIVAACIAGAILTWCQKKTPPAAMRSPIPNQYFFYTQWDQNTETDLAGYFIYLGSESNKYHGRIKMDLVQYLHGIPAVPVLKRSDGGPVFVRVSAYNHAGLEGEWSDEARFPPAPPEAP